MLFPFFCSVLSKNSTCCHVLVSVGMNVALHVFSIVVDIF